MPKTDALALSILDRMIEQREQQLRNAEMTSNTSLAARMRRELSALQSDRKKLQSGRTPVTSRPRPAETFSIGSRSGPVARRTEARARKSSRRPRLLDESTVVPAHSARWEELSAYILHLNDFFPGEDLMSLAGLFSTEREFARHIRRLESRLPAGARRRAGAQRKKAASGKAARKKTAARKATRARSAAKKTARKKATRKATPRKKASGTRKTTTRRSAARTGR